jgi:AraC-like DNA-binding protein
MLITTFKPADPVGRSLVDAYQLYQADSPMLLKTLPNGRVNAWITLEGTFYMELLQPGQLMTMPEAGFFPLTSAAGTLRITAPLKVVSIKFFPHILSLPVFRHLSGCQVIEFSSLFEEKDLRELKSGLNQTQTSSERVTLLDQFFRDTFFAHQLPDPWIGKVIGLIEAGASASTSISDIAEKACVSVKTLDRRFKQYTGLSPKLFAGVMRFQQTMENIYTNTGGEVLHGDLSPLLGTGYYDQSHFIKACRKITGMAPRDLFATRPATTTDVVLPISA